MILENIINVTIMCSVVKIFHDIYVLQEKLLSKYDILEIIYSLDIN